MLLPVTCVARTQWTYSCAESCSDADKNTAVLELLRKHGARHSLHYAAEYGVLDDVAAHIAEGADVNARDQRGKTPMDVYAAVSSSDADKKEAVLELLGKHSARTTSLHVVVRGGLFDSGKVAAYCDDCRGRQR